MIFLLLSYIIFGCMIIYHQIKLSLVLLPTCTATLLAIQLLMGPILAFKKTSNVDEFMVQNQRTRTRQNYVLQRGRNNDEDRRRAGLTYVSDPLSVTDPEELPAMIVDYANMIRNDIILLDNSVETRTRKRGNIKVENYDQGGVLMNEVPCRCELESKDPIILDSDHFPRSIETRKCNDNLCPNPYKCRPQFHNITILKRNRRLTQSDKLSSEEVPVDIAKHWVAIKKPVVVGCSCLRNYDGTS